MGQTKQLPVKAYSYPLPLWLAYYQPQSSFDERPDLHPHRHQYHEILFFREARNVKHHLDFTPYNVEPGAVFFVQPRQVHLVDGSSSKCQYALYVLTFSEDFLAAVVSDSAYLTIIHDLFAAGIVQTDEVSASCLMALWQQMQQEINSKELGYEQVVINSFRSLLILLRRQVAQLQPTAGDGSAAFLVFTAFQQLLDAHYHQHWSVSQYADALHITTRQLHRVCSKLKACSAQVIIHDRLNIEAKRELVYSNLAIKEVAVRLGFTDQSYFSRFFIRLNNESPETFRAKMSQKYR